MTAELSSLRVCSLVQLCCSEYGVGGGLAGRQALGPPSRRVAMRHQVQISRQTHSHSEGPLGKMKTKENSDKPQVSQPHARLSDNAATLLFSTFHLIRLELTYFEYQEKGKRE